MSVRGIWAATWPKLAAAGLGVFVWQCVVWTHWKPEYILPGPGKVLPALSDLVRTGTFWSTMVRTLSRGVKGYAIAVVVGSLVGLAVARIAVLRTAIGSMITGLQTM